MEMERERRRREHKYKDRYLGGEGWGRASARFRRLDNVDALQMRAEDAFADADEDDGRRAGVLRNDACKMR